MKDDIETLRRFVSESTLGPLHKIQHRQYPLYAIDAIAAARDSLRAKLEKAREALEPFAKAAEFFDGADWHGDERPSGAQEIGGIEAGWLRRARAVLSELSADAPAQPKISDDVRALLDEAIAALETIGRQIADGNTGLATKTTYDTLTKLRAARNG